MLLKVLTCVIVLSAAGCDQSFEPQIPGTSAPIVTSILATNKPDQFVRILTTYPSSISDPRSNTFDYPVTDATVTLSDGVTTYVFADTILPRIDTSRYTKPIHAYISSGLILQYGKSYTLHITSPSIGALTSRATVPSRPAISLPLTGRLILERPEDYQPGAKFQTNATLSQGAHAYIFRLVVSYDVLEENGWVRKREEIPVRFKGNIPRLENAIYGKVTRVQVPNLVNVYTNSIYYAMLADILARTAPRPIIFNYAVLQFIQLDKDLYHYYSNVSGFQDPFSLRLDQTNYSNIEYGAGIFASYSVDSLTQILPSDFYFNRRQ